MSPDEDWQKQHHIVPVSRLALIGSPGTPPEAVAALRGKRAVDGDVSAFTLMANLYYDIDADSGWKPYVGGGVGLSRLSISSRSRATGVTLADDEDTVFAYKVGAGIGYDIDVNDETSGERPVTVSLDYRYFGTEDPTFRGSVTGTKFDTEQEGHYIGASLKVWFLNDLGCTLFKSTPGAVPIRKIFPAANGFRTCIGHSYHPANPIGPRTLAARYSLDPAVGNNSAPTRYSGMRDRSGREGSGS